MTNFENYFKNDGWSLQKINEKVKKSPQEFINHMESTFKKQITETVDYIESKRPECKILMLSGPSSSGKTTTANMIKDELVRRGIWTTVISLDDFLVEVVRRPRLEDGSIDFESINVLDICQIKTALTGIIYENFCDMPIYDFSKMAPSTKRRQIKLPENGIIIIEGLHALNPIITEDLPAESIIKIYVSVENDVDLGENKTISAKSIRLTRRVLRDFHFRYTSAVDTILMWNNVCRGENLYIKPFKNDSDITINSFHGYEIGVMAAQMIELCASVPKDLEIYEAIKRLCGKLSLFEPVDNALVPATSLLKEFIK